MCEHMFVLASVCLSVFACVNFLFSIVALRPSHQVIRYAEKGKF